MNAQFATQEQNQTVGFMDLHSFELFQRVAGMFSKSTLVPKEYQLMTFDSKTGEWVKNEQALSNCIIALNMANRMSADPLMVMQNLVIVHGRPTWSSQFLIATFNSCGRFSSLRYEFFGEKDTDSWGCRAVAIELASGVKLTGTDVTIAIAKSEGWYGKNGSKWKTMPQQMLMYRAALWFVRANAPELSMGLHTQEEVVDGVIDITPSLEKPQATKTKVKTRSVDDLIDEDVITDSVPQEPVPEKQDVVEKSPPDPYGSWLTKIEDCQNLSDIARLLKEMPPNIKADLKEHVGMRQDEIKQQKEHHE